MRIPRAVCALLFLTLPHLLAATPSGETDPGIDPWSPEGKTADLRAFQEAEARRLRPLDIGTPAYYPPYDPDPVVDITHYRIELDLDTAARTFSGRTTITGEARRDDADSVTLDFCGPPVSAVREGGADAAFSWVDGALTVTLDPPRAAHETFEIEVEYAGIKERGMIFPSAAPGTVTAVYTFSEPENARYWYPCVDVPYDKATSEMIVTVPDDYKVGSNGVLVAEEALAGGRRRFHWNNTEPISTYLISMAAAPYTILADSTSAGLPILNYVYPADAAQGLRTFRPMPEMIDYFASLFGPYPFGKYGHTQAGFPGGMEHQSLTLLAEFAVRDSARYQWLLAHELAHQWFGDHVTPKDWRHIWLNEGFASYGDVLWAEHTGGVAGRNARIKVLGDLFKFGFVERNIAEPVLNPPGSALFSFTVYNKGAWILHTLRRIVGDDAFFDILKNYQAAHAFGHADTDDFIAACEARHGADLGWFFDSWLHEPGIPRFALSWSQTPAGKDSMRVAVTLRQTQASPFYPLPLDFAFHTDLDTLVATRFIDRNPQTFEVTVRGTLPDTGVVVDPFEWVLKTVDTEPLVPVRLLAFTAERSARGAVIRWRIDEASERYFFTVYRQPAGKPREPVDPALLGGRTAYSVTDPAAPEGAADYWLRAVGPAGEVEWYGPAALTGAAPPSAALVLMPNTPNPFRTATSISYSLPEAAFVRLEVLDTQGRSVARLVDRIESSGPHSAVWDGRTHTGARAAPGLYFIRLSSGGREVVRKAVLR